MKEKSNKKTKDKVLSGLVWTFGERILAQGVSFVLSIILARILMPSEYGIIAMVMVFINIANVFTSTGFGESLVQKKMRMN
ncbi:oligosaccharide flippase family protein [Ruminococcus faecis]|uniref:Oligosaccharide flippase family protein n=1 Tax=Mediterraneibacter faecis TaxID=592978 RepID=A0A844KAF4_9FIRM|nr:oligosaccharide flippase family protein [Mediterraneibacter faecis]MTR75416.1 oligosaccharide flippase family protein [Mediterraneibacter faecis]